MKKLIYCLFAFSITTTALTSCDVERVGVSIQPERPVYVRPAAPSASHIWVEGDWVYTNGNYAWHEGYWAAPRRGRVWVAGNWEQGRRGYYWRAGHWR